MPLNPVPNYPTSLDSLPDPTESTYTDDDGFELDLLLKKINAIVELLETKLGTGSSTATANNILLANGSGSTAFGKLTNAYVDAAAAIARSKLDFGSGLVNADIAAAAAIVYSKLALSNSIVAGDLTAGSTMKKIQTATPSGGQISFSSIPTGYSSLKLVLTGRSTQAATTTAYTMRLGTGGSVDSGANYDVQINVDSAASPGTLNSMGQTSINMGSVAGDSAPAGNAGTAEILLPHYTNTSFHKRAMGKMFVDFGTSSNEVTHYDLGAKWRNTGAITNVELNLAAGNWAAGTVCELYGLPS